MKSPEAVLRTALVGNTSVTSLVGTRIYPLLAPKTAALPFITWRRSGISREHTLAGPMGVPNVSVEMQSFAATYEDVREVADRVRLVLDGYGGTVNNVEVKHVSLEQESDDFVQLAGGDLPPAYQVTQTFNVLWQET
jgi:hypothetical protein